MEIKNNIAKLRNCYGCGVCVKACPVKIISLKENADGFYEPIIDQPEKCIECGKCLKTCAFYHDSVAQDQDTHPKAYAVWSNDKYIRERCSSGGIGFEIGKLCISNGYRAIGVKYNPNSKRAEHFIASTIEDFKPSIGSKYIQSYTSNGFEDIDLKQKYLITGTPCQIDSIRRYIKMMNKEDNFILLDFFCHGVPSLLLWDKYLNEIEQKIGNTTFISWRNKTNGWHDSWSMEADTGSFNLSNNYNLNESEKIHQYSSRMSNGDLFYSFFLGNYCLNKCCYATCKYKMLNSAADIRIGDLWGDLYSKEERGVSAAIAMTSKGESLLDALTESCTIIPHSITEACQGQMKKNAYEPPIRLNVIKALQGSKTLAEINNYIIKPYRRRFLPGRICNRLLRMFNLKPIFPVK